MKLKIYVIKKQQLLWAAIILSVVVIAAILLISLRTTKTFDFFNASHTYKSDINNDGKVDSVVTNIDEKTQKYLIDVICSDGNGYNLQPDPVINCFGYNSDKWPVNVTFNDINDDGCQEIFIQSADTNGPILHIFQYAKGKFERLASGRYSIYGVIKGTTDSNGLIVLVSSSKSNFHLTYLKPDFGRLVPYSSAVSLTLGKDVISSLVNYIEQKDIATFNLNVDKKLNNDVSKGNFLDGIISSAKFSKYDIPSECTYIMRTDTQNEDKNSLLKYRVKLSLSKYDKTNPEYNIVSIDKIK